MLKKAKKILTKCGTFHKNVLIDFVFDGSYDFQMAQKLEQNENENYEILSPCVCVNTKRINSHSCCLFEQLLLLIPLLLSLFVISGLDYERKIKRVA